MSTLVIGSGITGMAAAILLAQQGEETTLLEAAPIAAPLLRGFERGGLHFDTGFHCGAGLRQGGLLRLWLQTLGIMDFIADDACFPTREEFHFLPDGVDPTPAVIHFPASLDGLIPAVSGQFGEQAAQKLRQVVQDMLAVMQHSPYTNPHSDAALHFSFAQGPTLCEALTKAQLPPRLARMVQVRCALYGVAPHKATFHEFSLVGGLYFDSSHGIRGGGQTLRMAALAALERAGVPVRCHARVTHIRHTGNSVSGVELASGERLACTRCVFTGHPGQLATITDTGAMRPAFFRHIAEMREGMQALLVFCATRNPVLQGKTLYLMPPDSVGDHELLAPLEQPHPLTYLVCGDAHAEEFPVMLIAPTRHVFPAGCPTPRPEAYRHWKQEATARLLAYVCTRLPELDDLRMLDAATPLSLRRWITGSTGSLYGLVHDMETLALFPTTRLNGLFLAGQNILLPGILGGIISAALAVGFATSHDTVLQGFRQWAHSA